MIEFNWNAKLPTGHTVNNCLQSFQFREEKTMRKNQIETLLKLLFSLMPRPKTKWFFSFGPSNRRTTIFIDQSRLLACLMVVNEIHLDCARSIACSNQFFWKVIENPSSSPLPHQFMENRKGESVWIIHSYRWLGQSVLKMTSRSRTNFTQ